MPAKDPAAYMRERRAAAKTQIAKTTAVPEPLPELKKTGYDCGCRPGDRCMSHGIQQMSQKRIDAILKEINRGPR